MSHAVVSDSSPINYLVLIDAVDLLPRLFSEVYIPAAVVRELTSADTPPRVRSWMQQAPPWVKTASSRSSGPSFGLDDGEAEAIRLAQELGILTLLIDERNGHQVAESLGLRPIGVLGILELCASKGWIAFGEYIARIRTTNFRFHERLIAEALARLSRK